MKWLETVERMAAEGGGLRDQMPRLTASVHFLRYAGLEEAIL